MRRPWIIPFVAMLAMGLPFMVSWWARWDSAVHAAVAWRMALSGDWLSMWAGESSYFNKPPLAIWVLAGVFKSGLACGLLSPDTGPPVWLIRAPSLVAAMLCVRLLVAIVTRTHGVTSAVAAGWVLALTPPFFLLLNEKVVDFWHLLGLLGVLWFWVRGAEEGRVRWLVAGGVPMGLALLCKPAGALLALPIGLVWLAVARRWRLMPALLLSGVVAVAVAAPWYAAMMTRFGDAFVHAHFGREIGARASGAGFGADPWWWYGWWLGRRYQPWLVLLLVAPAVLWVQRRWGSHRATGQPEAEPLLLPVVWSVGWLVLLSCFPDKRSAYAAPVYASMAWVCGVVMVRVVPALRAPWLLPMGEVVAGVMLAGSVGVTAWVAMRGPSGDGGALVAVAPCVRAAEPGRVWSGEMRHSDAANFYLCTGRWPRASMNDGELNIALDAPFFYDVAYRPPAVAGDLVVYAGGGAASPPPDAEVVAHAGRLTVVRWPDSTRGR